jgi:hypothetical protein
MIEEEQMAKYDQNITTECVKEVTKRPGHYISTTRHLENFGGGELSIDCIYVVEPHLILTQPHQHEFGQYLNFFSANPNDPRDFDAEIELSLGEEPEKRVITCPTSVYVPAGLLHGPLDFKRVGKPFLFLDIAATGKYKRVGDTPD